MKMADLSVKRENVELHTSPLYVKLYFCLLLGQEGGACTHFTKKDKSGSHVCSMENPLVILNTLKPRAVSCSQHQEQKVKASHSLTDECLNPVVKGCPKFFSIEAQ